MSRGQYTISHRLFVFFTQELGTCYQFHRGYENGKIRVNLQIYGTFMLNFFKFSLLTFFFTGDELHNETAIINTFEDAKDACSQIGILLPRRDQSRADGAGGTGESLRCPIVSPYLNTLLIFKMSDTSFFTPSRRSL
jgi:hypothetical protein